MDRLPILPDSSDEEMNDNHVESGVMPISRFTDIVPCDSDSDESVVTRRVGVVNRRTAGASSRGIITYDSESPGEYNPPPRYKPKLEITEITTSDEEPSDYEKILQSQGFRMVEIEIVDKEPSDTDQPGSSHDQPGTSSAPGGSKKDTSKEPKNSKTRRSAKKNKKKRQERDLTPCYYRDAGWETDCPKCHQRWFERVAMTAIDYSSSSDSDCSLDEERPEKPLLFRFL